MIFSKVPIRRYRKRRPVHRSQSESDLNAEISECQPTENTPKAKSKLETITKIIFNRAKTSKNTPDGSPNKDAGSSSGAWLNKMWYTY